MRIEILNLTKRYGDQKAVDNVSFGIETGEIVGFIGPNGAGKSTTMKILTGYIGSYEGEVLVGGAKLRESINEIKQTIGYLPEHNPLYLDMYVREYLSFVAGVYKVGGRSKIEEVIELTGLGRESNKKIQSLSKGYRQRVGLASALLPNPSILILDEPTTGLDPNQIIEIRNVIATVGKEKTVLLSTHLMQEVEAICNRVVIIDKGKIVANDGTQNIRTGQTSVRALFVEFASAMQQSELKSIDGVVTVEKISNSGYLIEYDSDVDPRIAIFNCAVRSNNPILTMNIQVQSMEDAFRKLTNN